jgi:hypothetical protein
MRASRLFLNIRAGCTAKRFRQILTTNDPEESRRAKGFSARAAVSDNPDAFDPVTDLFTCRSRVRRDAPSSEGVLKQSAGPGVARNVRRPRLFPRSRDHGASKSPLAAFRPVEAQTANRGAHLSPPCQGSRLRAERSSSGRFPRSEAGRKRYRPPCSIDLGIRLRRTDG